MFKDIIMSFKGDEDNGQVNKAFKPDFYRTNRES